MRIDAVEFFYLSMPTITTEADGSQDALLVRVTAGRAQGRRECECEHGHLLIDAGQIWVTTSMLRPTALLRWQKSTPIWGDDVDAAANRLSTLAKVHTEWLELTIALVRRVGIIKHAY